MNLSDEGKRLIAVTSSEPLNTVLLYLMKTKVFHLLDQSIGLPEEVQKLFTNYKYY